MRVVTVVLCMFWLLAANPVSGQFGISGKYQHINSPRWEVLFDLHDNVQYVTDLVGISGYYWFRLKEIRIEFLPEIGYARSFGQNSTGRSSELQILSALLNVQIYPFDLISDCDCPTFSKQGSFLQKAFFIELTGGLDHHMLALTNNSDDTELLNISESLFRKGFGVGVDIGISDLLTLTPLVFIQWHQSPDYQGLPGALGEPYYEFEGWATQSYPGVGLRAIFRPDYLRR